MEFIEGESLAQRLERGSLPAQEAGQITLALLSALDAFHKMGIVHRDLKPGNIVLSNGDTKLLDFGIAKHVPVNAAEETVATLTDATLPGVFLGTPRYASPEQFRGQPVDARSDLFSMGAILFEMLTGQPPFPGESFGEIAHAVLHGSPPALSGSPAIVAMGRIVHRALAREPQDRYPNAQAMAQELRATLLMREEGPALDMLSRAIDHGFFCHQAMVRDPWLDALRARAEFTELLRKAHQLHVEALTAFVSGGGPGLLGLRSEAY